MICKFAQEDLHTPTYGFKKCHWICICMICKFSQEDFHTLACIFKTCHFISICLICKLSQEDFHTLTYGFKMAGDENDASVMSHVKELEEELGRIIKVRSAFFAFFSGISGTQKCWVILQSSRNGRGIWGAWIFDCDTLAV